MVVDQKNREHYRAAGRGDAAGLDAGGIDPSGIAGHAASIIRLVGLGLLRDRGGLRRSTLR